MRDGQSLQMCVVYVQSAIPVTPTDSVYLQPFENAAMLEYINAV